MNAETVIAQDTRSSAIAATPINGWKGEISIMEKLDEIQAEQESQREILENIFERLQDVSLGGDGFSTIDT